MLPRFITDPGFGAAVVVGPTYHGEGSTVLSDAEAWVTDPRNNEFEASRLDCTQTASAGGFRRTFRFPQEEG